jgi:DNA-binding transcriptional LysR family regulator
MPNNNMKRLKAFVAVAESGSVTEAANQLALTQSGVSRQISAMEEDVGFALFDRVRGRLLVSQKGAAFLRHARRTLDVVENLPRAALAIASGAEDRVVIAGTSAVVHGLMPFVVAEYTTERLGASPGIIMRSQQEFVDLGQHGHFDLIIVPARIRPPYYDLIQSIEFDLYFAGPIELLPKGGQEMSLSHLSGQSLISLDPFENYQESVERALKKKKIDVQMACETSSVMAAARLVDLGVGCAFLDPFVAHTLNNPTVGIRKLSPHITHSYSILAPSNASISEEASKFLKCLNDVADVLK